LEEEEGESQNDGRECPVKMLAKSPAYMGIGTIILGLHFE
jgi:hypothetical protein